MNAELINLLFTQFVGGVSHAWVEVANAKLKVNMGFRLPEAQRQREEKRIKYSKTDALAGIS